MSEPPRTLCDICKKAQATSFAEPRQENYYTTQRCPDCGTWGTLMDSGAMRDIRSDENAALVPYLAAYIRRRNAEGESVVDLTADNWRGFADQHARTPIARRLDLLLRWFETNSGFAGDYVELVRGTFPFVDARNDREVAFLCDTLVSRQLLERRREAMSQFRITAEGWNSLHPLTSGGVSGTCFVAMSFNPALDAVFFQGILPAVEIDCHYVANRVDRVPHNDNISDRIIAGIRASQFLVADFTEHKPGVYYEAGFAEGLGRTVIRTCRDTDFDKLHFDTRQFAHLKWSTVADLREQLADHIAATIGKWEQGR